MTITQSLLLGLIQGFSEFLPISSSGHLVLVQNWMEIYPPPFFFDIFLHFISVLVLIYYFRREILHLQKKEIFALAVATIPIIVAGYFLQDYIQEMFHSTFYAGMGLILTGAFNLWTAKQYRKSTDSKELKASQALVVGIAQAAAIIPGISRSGSTLFGASIINVNKKKAFEFSFMMGIIAILIANLAQIVFIDKDTLTTIALNHWSNYLFGGIACFIVSFFSLNLLKKALDNTQYHWFGWYCIFIGSFSIFLRLI